MSLRSAVFWLHVIVGVVAGGVILFMSVTGVILAFEPQVTAWLERDRRVIAPPPDARPLSAEAILARAREARPDVRATAVTLRADPTASAVVSFGREGGALFVDQYRGVVLGGLSPVHDALHEVVEWHRWLGSREIGRPITGAANLGFLGLVVLGVYLWWPRRWTREAVRAVTLFRSGLGSRARDFNWHNVIGIWCAPVLLILTLTGVIMSYQWAGNLLYTLTGNEPPPPAAAPVAGGPAARDDQRRPRAGALEPGRAPVGLDALWARAERQVPGWVAINARLPQRPDGAVTFFIQEPGGWHPTPRAQLVLDPFTAEVVRWEPFAEQNMGRRLRAWVRPLHTGEAAGLLGQAIALVASAGGAVLVWTGIALAWRRFRSRRRRARSTEAILPPAASQEVSAD
jgi:uncharacterized iron-regulated membrane protein